MVAVALVAAAVAILGVIAVVASLIHHVVT
jgi:hypothetical protein